MQMVLLILAGLGCPIAYGALISRMRTQRIEKPPIIPMFFLFGTIGGWMLAFALSPSGLAAMCIIFLMTAAPIALFVASVGLSSMRNKTIYHRVAMWSGFTYPVFLGLFFAAGFLLDRNPQAEAAPEQLDDELPPFRDDYCSNCRVSITSDSGYSVSKTVDYFGIAAKRDRPFLPVRHGGTQSMR